MSGDNNGYYFDSSLGYLKKKNKNENSGLSRFVRLAFFCLVIVFFMSLVIGYVDWKISDILSNPIIVGDETNLEEIFSEDSTGSIVFNLREKDVSNLTETVGMFKYNDIEYYKAVVLTDNGEKYSIVFTDKSFYDNLKLDDSFTLNIYGNSSTNFYGLSELTKTKFHIVK